MRLAAQALVILLLALAPVEAAAQGRATICRPLAERGRVWADCCVQSYVRNPRLMTRSARIQQIERCVRNRLRAPQ
jgi:hypothetical protein